MSERGCLLPGPNGWTAPRRALLRLALLALVWGLGAGMLPARAQGDVAVLLSQPTVQVPPTLDPADVARQSVALHEESGGSTVSLYFGDLAGQRLYVVDLFPERERVVPGTAIPVALVEQFIADNRDLLTDPRNTVGTYFDDATGNSYVNVSTALPDRDQAVALARRHNQQFVFDLGTMGPIPTGGTGEAPAELPPLDQRLPPLAVEAAPR